MIYNKPGAVFEYDGVQYTVGCRVKGTAVSEYEGLYGRILEIRTEDDRETDNETPEIYCSFNPPVLQKEIRELEEVFSDLYGQHKTLDEIILDLVIMAPDMIVPLHKPGENQPKATIYMVVSHWAVRGEGGMSADIFTCTEDAQLKFHDDLLWEKESGCLADWSGKDSFIEEDTDKGYEGYLDGEYCENHFSIEIQTQNIPVSSDFICALQGTELPNCKEDNT